MTDQNTTASDRSGLILADSPPPSDEEINQAELAGMLSARKWLLNSRMNACQTTFWRRLHKEIFGEVWSWASVWRTAVTNIGVQPIQIPVQMRELENDLTYWLSEECEMHKAEILARFHRKAVWIHPFVNGNGRWSRLATDALNIKKFSGGFLNWAAAGEDLRNAASPGRLKYLAAMQAGDKGDIEPLIQYLCELNLGFGLEL